MPPSTVADRPHVLVVDDEREIRDLLVTVLEQRGYRVTARADGTTALGDLDAGDVELLITDLRMPEVDGLQLVERAKERQPDLASIVVTAYASTESAVQALRFGVDDFITKPFTVSDLCRTVERVLDARRLVTTDLEALGRIREEADRLRRRQRSTEDALAHARRDLDDSRKNLDRRLEDLAFIAEFTALLAKETELESLLERTVRVLGRRFRADVVRLEIALPDGIHVTEHAEPGIRSGPLGPIARDLFHRARSDGPRPVNEIHLLGGRPVQAMAVPIDLPTGPAGGLLLLRPALKDADEGNLFLLSLVPRALGVALEGEVRRREASATTLRIATGMLEALEERGTLPRGHGQRVANLAVPMAQALGLSTRFQRIVENAARLHDVGAVGVSEDLLRRPGPLSPTDRGLLRTLPMVAARILAPFGEAALFVKHIHERPDGRGYPDGLQGDAIPLGAAIIGCAEAFDAITHHRPWRPSRSRSEALAEIERHAGTQFAPGVVAALRAALAGQPS